METVQASDPIQTYEGKIKIFGAALDVLPSPERLNLKRAYIHHIRENPLEEKESKDPYDFFKNHFTNKEILNSCVEWIGKVSFPSWISPKPKLADLSKLSVNKYDRFLKTGGCKKCALKIAEFINKQILPCKPIMIGVDHSLTGGSIMALAEKYPNLNVVILDAHFDVINTDRVYALDRQRGNTVFSLLNERKSRYETPLNYYGCGNFLDYLLKREVIAPKNLWIIGVQDEIYREVEGRRDLGGNFDRNVASVKKWMGTGVHVIFKHEVQSGDFEIDLSGPTYLSIDIDVGSMASVFSARFMNSYGLDTAEFLQLLYKVSGFIRSNHYPLVGLDVMEFDVHFFEAIEQKKIDDRTEEIVKEIFRLFINKNGCQYA